MTFWFSQRSRAPPGRPGYVYGAQPDAGRTLSTLLFVPTSTGLRNLEREGIADGAELVDDVMLDAFRQTAAEDGPPRALLERLGVTADYVPAALHRAETTSNAHDLLSRIDYLVELAAGRPVVLPIDPRARVAAAQFAVDFGSVLLVEPIDYVVFAGLLAGCSPVATDSRGHKEAYSHRVACITLRSETEWPETIEAGWNRLWTSPDWATPRRDIEDYGAGKAAERIVESINSGIRNRLARARPSTTLLRHGVPYS